jgi:hypothetical protein
MNDRTIEPRRLDVVLAETLPDQVVPAYIQEFEALLKARRGGASRMPSASLEGELVDFVMPRITDASIFQGRRFTALLGDLKTRLPAILSGDPMQLEVDEVIEEELARYWAIQDRRHKGSRR